MLAAIPVVTTTAPPTVATAVQAIGRGIVVLPRKYAPIIRALPTTAAARSKPNFSKPNLGASRPKRNRVHNPIADKRVELAIVQKERQLQLQKYVTWEQQLLEHPVLLNGRSLFLRANQHVTKFAVLRARHEPCEVQSVHKIEFVISALRIIL